MRSVVDSAVNRDTDGFMIIVTHRPAALGICDKILEFTGDGIIEREQDPTENK